MPEQYQTTMPDPNAAGLQLKDPWAEFKQVEPASSPTVDRAPVAKHPWENDPVVEDAKPADPYAEFKPAWQTGIPVDQSQAPAALPAWQQAPAVEPSVPMIGNHPAFDYYDKQHAENQKVTNAIHAQMPFARVLDAFKQGAKDGWGAAPLGLDAETEDALRKAGIITDPAHPRGIYDSFKAFNEGLIRPAAAVLHTVMRSGASVIDAYGSAAGAIADESGLTKTIGAPEGSAVRDFKGMAETIATVLGGRVPELPEAVFAKADSLGVLHEGRPVPETPSRGPAIPDATEPFEAKPAMAAASNVRPEAISKPITPATDTAGNINLQKINAPEDVKDVIRQTAQDNSDFFSERRGEISLAQTEEMANALGMTPADLSKRKIGQAFNAEELTAARQLLVQSATEVRDLAAKAVGGTDADKAAFVEAALRHTTIQEQVAGMTAEAGRALSAFRIQAGDAQAANTLGDLLKNMGDADDMAQKITQLDTPQKVSRFLMDARNSGTSDKIVEAWINGLLSGPQTHVRNVVSNAVTAIWHIPETYAAAAIGKARQALGSEGEAIPFGEAGARAYAMIRGAKEGVIAGAKAFKTEMSSDGLGRVEFARPRAIPSATVNVAGKELELGGKQIRLPSRALMAEDEFSKAIARRQEIHGLAYRQATKEGLAGDDFASRVAELENNPTPEMQEAAQKFAEYQTFQSPLGEVGQAVMKLSNSSPLMKPVITFVRTPINIYKVTAAKTPAGLLLKDVRADLSGANGPIARDMALARMTLGTSVGVAALTLAGQGFITGGGPSDPREKALLYATGWQPYSVRIGETYYSYTPTEPFSTILGFAADAHDIMAKSGDDVGDVPAAFFGSIVKGLVNKSYLKGAADIIQAIEDPERYGKRYIQNQLTSVIPNFVTQFARTEDPVLRETRGLLDAFKAKIPGLSTTLLPRRDVWGEPITHDGNLGPDAISPFYESRLKHDPVTQELLTLGIYPGQLQRRIRGVTLTPEEYDDYQRIAGRLMRRALASFISMDGYQDVPAALRKRALPKFIDRAREMARAQVLMMHPRIVKEATRLKIKDLGGE
ncbi:MAG TPA: hypothetical protein VHE09_14600 [Rhizomicrobium sp.]|nr:hypothetical protein [Rhizomicrobium sp.]